MGAIDIIIKDLKVLISDRKALGILILMPIILTTILSYALKGAFTNTPKSRVEIAIVKNYDRQEQINKLGNESINGDEIVKQLDVEKIFIDEFLGSEEIQKIIQYRVVDEKEGMNLLKNREISSVVILKEDFIYDMTINLLTTSTNKVKIDIVADPDKYISRQIVEQIINGFCDTMSSIIIGKNVLEKVMTEEGIQYQYIGNVIEEINKSILDTKVDINYTNTKGKDPITSSDYYSVAMATMFILFAAGYGSKMLLEEKDNITYQRMMISGISKWKVVVGKFIALFLIALGQISILIIYSTITLKVNWGNLYLVTIISLCSVFSIAGLGTMIAAITYRVGNYKMANAFESVIIQIMALLGGSFFPIDILPSFIQRFSILSLNGLALKSYLSVISGYGMKDIATNIITLIVIGIIFTCIAVYVLVIEGRGSYDEYTKVKTT
ncbi:ABC transporter permease [Alkalithermobacter paradoxus]|uniref:ABC-2 family transporter protein n=1 Tax=Alkalithermobacter paradoxus TaxID=29349 RepID=A0A1V4IA86_9FIRM|nr:ABC-2 family transporter protein [[Clostridium] thermoalcaliphilum]